MRNFHQKSCSLPSTQVPASTRVVTQCEKGRVTSSNDRNKGEWLTNHCMIVFFVCALRRVSSVNSFCVLKFQTICESKTRVKLHIKQSRISLNYITRLGIEFQYLIWERSIYFPLNSKTSLMSGYSRKNKPDDCFTWIVHFIEVDLLLIIISFGKFFAFLTCKMYR